MFMWDKDADEDKALAIINNAKTSRPSVCNAMEVLLVHEDKGSKLPSSLGTSSGCRA